jgi:hypothetical protein
MVGGYFGGVRRVALRELWASQADAIVSLEFSASLANEWLYAGASSGMPTMMA